MEFARNSRYYGVKIAKRVEPDENGNSREISYLTRRWPADEARGVTMLEHRLAQGERLDHLAARYFGDATQFWRLCDFNLALNPDDLVDTPGRFLRIPLSEL